MVREVRVAVDGGANLVRQIDTTLRRNAGKGRKIDSR
jgi:hypothetical protein